jgi:hypothetical protein
MIDVQISHDNDNGEFEFIFSQAGYQFKIECPAVKDNQDMQLYFNYLGWPDNNTYIQIHEVVYDPPKSSVAKLVSTEEGSEKPRVA